MPDLFAQTQLTGGAHSLEKRRIMDPRLRSRKPSRADARFRGSLPPSRELIPEVGFADRPKPGDLPTVGDVRLFSANGSGVAMQRAKGSGIKKTAKKTVKKAVKELQLSASDAVEDAQVRSAKAVKAAKGSLKDAGKALKDKGDASLKKVKASLKDGMPVGPLGGACGL